MVLACLLPVVCDPSLALRRRPLLLACWTRPRLAAAPPAIERTDAEACRSKGSMCEAVPVRGRSIKTHANRNTRAALHWKSGLLSPASSPPVGRGGRRMILIADTQSPAAWGCTRLMRIPCPPKNAGRAVSAPRCTVSGCLVCAFCCRRRADPVMRPPIHPNRPGQPTPKPQASNSFDQKRRPKPDTTPAAAASGSRSRNMPRRRSQ